MCPCKSQTAMEPVMWINASSVLQVFTDEALIPHKRNSPAGSIAVWLCSLRTQHPLNCSDVRTECCCTIHPCFHPVLPGWAQGNLAHKPLHAMNTSTCATEDMQVGTGQQLEPCLCTRHVWRNQLDLLSTADLSNSHARPTQRHALSLYTGIQTPGMTPRGFLDAPVVTPVALTVQPRHVGPDQVVERKQSCTKPCGSKVKEGAKAT